jgi:hypothetical protein
MDPTTTAIVAALPALASDMVSSAGTRRRQKGLLSYSVPAAFSPDGSRIVTVFYMTRPTRWFGM